MTHTAKDTLRIAALSDSHCTTRSQGLLQPIFAQMSASADVIALCGDLTDYGLPEEASVLAEEFRNGATVPVVAVLGNHDYESAKPDEVKRILCDAGITILDGDICEVNGVGFAGVKGFGGGFGRRALEPWGEPMIKAFVQEAMQEGLKLQTALAQLRTPARIAIMHYAPIEATIAGEPCEIFPFLGSSHLEAAVNSSSVAAVFHGHAHYGSPEGRTSNGTPVYNVALPLMRQMTPEHPFRVFSVPLVVTEPATR